MVFVFEFDDGEPEPPSRTRESCSEDDDDTRRLSFAIDHYHSLRNALPNVSLDGSNSEEHSNVSSVNINSFSAALACYPIASSLASHLDLNSLHNLSRTCRQFRGTLLMFRDQLVSRTLRCENEDKDSGSALARAFMESRSAWEGSLLDTPRSRRLQSGHIGKCARDMIMDCRRCGAVVCRNCVSKPPPTSTLKDRHRRLCRTCLNAPLELLLAPPTTANDNSPRPSPRSTPASLDRAHVSTSPCTTTTTTSSSSIRSSSTNPATANPVPLTRFAFQRTPCTCPTFHHLCVPCGRSLRAGDRLYASGWTWRTKYRSYTGVGEGPKGVECGLRQGCLAARLVEQEVDCDADAMREMKQEAAKVAADGSGRSWQGGSFEAQEVSAVGGGGGLKMKVRRFLKVGAEVDMYDDEGEEGAPVLEREGRGEQRSWCAWCERVIPGEGDHWNRRWDIGGDSC